MFTSGHRLVRLSALAAAAIGSCLVSTAASAADWTSPPTEPSVTEDTATEDTATEDTATEQIPPGDPVGVEPITPSPAVEEPAVEGSAVSEPEVEPVTIEAVVEPDEAPPAETTPETPPSTTEPDGGHDGGSGGEGNPYRMTFRVVWRTADGAVIADLDEALPEGWRNLFDLSATGQTGKSQTSTANCSYPTDSDDLVCEYANHGHGEGTDGMIVAGRPTATYTVSVDWSPTDWRITGANGGPYSARELCPRGEGGHDGDDGHDGHDGGGGGTSGSGTGGSGGEAEGGAQYCAHTVVMQQLAPEVLPPVTPTIPPTVPTVDASAGTLPATGAPTGALLSVGGLMIALGAASTLLARRRSGDGLS